MPQSKDILQLKISLQGIKPAIWREIIIPADRSFMDLHITIQNAMGWEDSHLHHFATAEPYKRNSQPQFIGDPEMLDREETLDERKTSLNKFLKTKGDTIWYEYDFGDSWMHEIKVTKASSENSQTIYPLLIDGARACPPDDCGGVPGYMNLLEALKDPKHPEHEEMLEWLGLDSAQDFDPEDFDKDAVEFPPMKK